MENENNNTIPQGDIIEEINGNAIAFAVMAYIGVLWLLGLLIKPENELSYVKNHVNNGIILFIAGVASGIISAIPAVGKILGGLLSVVLLVFAIIGIVNAAKRQHYTLPLVGDKITIVK